MTTAFHRPLSIPAALQVPPSPSSTPRTSVGISAPGSDPMFDLQPRALRLPAAALRARVGRIRLQLAAQSLLS